MPRITPLQQRRAANLEAFGPLAEGVRYNRDHSSCLCNHCDTEIQRGSNYAVILSNEEEGVPPFGPYCQDCLSKLRCCSGCRLPFFGEDIEYCGNGNHYCNGCKENLDKCEICDGMYTPGNLRSLSSNGKIICNNCYSSRYFVCSHCNREKTIARSGKSQKDTLKVAQYPSIYSGDPICDLCAAVVEADTEMLEVYECKKCGVHHSCADHKGYCRSCFGSIKPCTDCGKIHHHNRFLRVGLARTVSVCTRCRDKYRACGECGNFYRIVQGKSSKDIFGNIVTLMDRCPDCSADTQCKHCLNFVAVNENGICDTCNAASASKCEGCDSTLVHSYGNVSSCRECDKDESHILNYSFCPSPLRFSYTDNDLKSGDNLFLGTELELTRDNEHRNTRSNKLLFDLYQGGPYANYELNAKSDGSIGGNGGWEWVTGPMTLDYIKTSFDTTTWLKGMKAHHSCGMHIHADRRGLGGAMHIYKIINFIDVHSVLSTEIAGRDYTTFAGKLQDKATSLALKKSSGPRYSRVNIKPPNTIEFRLYASTTSEYLILMRLEHVHSLIKYLRYAGLTEVKKTDGYFKYVRDNCKLYSNLHKFLSSPARPWNDEDTTPLS